LVDNKIKDADEEFGRFPDEDKIEEVLDTLHKMAWETSTLTYESRTKMLAGVSWVLSIWNRTLGSETLLEILKDSYFNPITTADNDSLALDRLRLLDLVICFFHHYIYALDEFMNRKFRNSVIRCGLICERIVKRLAVASSNPEVLTIPKFEDRVNKLRKVLEGRTDSASFLANFLQYIYSQRTHKGAHDTKVATAIIAKSCINEAPTIYLLYLNSVVQLGYGIPERDALLEFVNSTISVGTSLIVAQEGETVRPDLVLESFFKQLFFSQERTMGEVDAQLKKLGYSYPPTSLFKALQRLSRREGILTKAGKKYAQRMPPPEYYKKELFD
jgi:hypothetical protein